MPVVIPHTLRIKGFTLIELPLLLLILAIALPALLQYQQTLQQQWLQLDRQQQAWALAYYSLVAVCSQPHEPMPWPTLPSTAWQRRWKQRSLSNNECQYHTITITAPNNIEARLTQICCANLLIDNSDDILNARQPTPQGLVKALSTDRHAILKVP
ncbi:MAG: prepilin-type N-terminal cleavage/methylation domain-containing protein [Candidatus Symbiodolus clandestinus]